jgi:hypothetical protein
MSAAASLWNGVFILWLILELAILHLIHQIKSSKSEKEKQGWKNDIIS